MALTGGRSARLGLLACVAVVVSIAASGCAANGNETPPIIYITLPPATGSPGPTPTIDSVSISTDAPDRSWTVTFKKPVVSGIPDAEAAKLNGAIATQVDSYIDAFTGGSLPAVEVGGAPSTLQGDFTVVLDRPNLLSFQFSLLTNVAGVGHAVGKVGSVNLVVTSGAKINLADIFTDPTAAVSTLASEAHADLASQLGPQLTWKGDAKSMSFFETGWAMTTAGLEFTWAQGDVANAVAGKPTTILPWSSLKPIIKQDSPVAELLP